MSRLFRVQAGEGNMKTYWTIGIVMAAGLRAQRQDCSVNVYILSGVPMRAGMLPDARTKATAMFREIGVNLRMRFAIPARDPSDGCGAPIVVQIEDATGYNGPSEALAYAMPYKESGTCIHMFLDRVLSLDPGRLDRDPLLANALLAHVIAHEITHVLEQDVRHSKQGVMKARWSSDDFQRMEHLPLSFAPEDVDLIHKGLDRGITHALAE
jgi:hypothetical protein